MMADDRGWVYLIPLLTIGYFFVALANVGPSQPRPPWPSYNSPTPSPPFYTGQTF
jgi:hypothetical protein